MHLLAVFGSGHYPHRQSLKAPQNGGSSLCRCSRSFFCNHGTLPSMRRLHLVEFGDLQWFPQVLRDAETAYLAAAYGLFPLAQRWAERISTVLDVSEPAEIIDLCSGPAARCRGSSPSCKARGYEVRAKLTDLYPNPQSAPHPHILWMADPVDATRVPPWLKGARTMFSAFHHFRPDAATAILKDAFDRRDAICIFESGSGTFLGILSMVGVPFSVLALMPLARPFRWAYLLLTYLIPLMPLVVLWDGMVSMLRIYSPEQMKDLTQALAGVGLRLGDRSNSGARHRRWAAVSDRPPPIHTIMRPRDRLSRSASQANGAAPRGRPCGSNFAIPWISRPFYSSHLAP